MQKKAIVGKKGEQIAQEFLISRNYKIIAINFHSRFGEIDIIAIERGIIHFCEVKTRTTLTFGTPEEAVNRKKIERMKKTIQCYQQENGFIPWQVDIIAIYLDHAQKTKKMIHYKNIPLS